MQSEIKSEAAKISVLSSGKIDNFGNLQGEEILSSNQRQIIEQAKFVHYLFGKALQKQTEKQVRALKSVDHSNKKDKLL